MESLRENRALLYSLLASSSAMVALASGILPNMAVHFEIVDISSEVSRLITSMYRVYSAMNPFVVCHYNHADNEDHNSVYGHLTSKVTSPLQSHSLSPKLFSIVQRIGR